MNPAALLHAQKLVEALLDNRRLEGWKLEGLRFDYTTETYSLVFSKDESSRKIAVPSEFIASLENQDDPFRQMKLKSLIKDALLK